MTLIAFLFSLGMIIFLFIGLLAIVVVPLALNALGLEGPLGWVISIARWPLMLVGVGIALTLVYRFGPSRAKPRWQWVSWGSAFAALAWLIVSALFSWYAANFGSFNATYGSLGAVIGFMTWLWLSASIVLLGAQINAEVEHRPAEDTTEGKDKPLGSRGAKAADAIGPPRS